MKKKFFYVGALALCTMLSFSSCSNDDDPINEGPGAEAATGDQVIVLDMQDTDVLTTKSRPLYSTDNKGAGDVTDVQLLVFGYDDENSIYKYVKTLPAINNWNNASNKYDYGRKYEIKLTGDAKLGKSTEEGGYTKYIILAVGQDESNTNAIPAPFKIKVGKDDKFVGELTNKSWSEKNTWNLATTPGAGFWQTTAINYAAKDGKNRVGEIFSGVSKPIEFTADGGFSTTVLLKRQVAGVLGYFNRIPSSVGKGQDAKAVTGIRMVASNRNNAVDLTISLDKQNDDATNGQPGHIDDEYIVNGFNATEPSNTPDAIFGKGEVKNANKNAYIVYDINLKDWFKWNDGKGWDKTALLDETSEDGVKLLGNVAGWRNALAASNSNVKVADGAVLAGEFVIPFDKTMSNTFELQLINTGDKGAVTVLKTWNIKLDSKSQSEYDHASNYSIYRNHLYQVGKRGDGDNPDNPGTDPDKPQPLDKDQELIIKINDNWEFIHDMEIE